MFGAFLEHHLFRTIVFLRCFRKMGHQGVRTRPSFFNTPLKRKVNFLWNNKLIWKHKSLTVHHFWAARLPKRCFLQCFRQTQKKQTRGQYSVFAHPRSPFAVFLNVSENAKKQKRWQYITFARPSDVNVKIHTVKQWIFWVTFWDPFGGPFFFFFLRFFLLSPPLY